MSEEANLALVRRIFEAWERGDYADVSWADPEIEFEIADGPEAGRGRGFAEMREAFGSWLSAFEGFEVAATAYESRGDVVLTDVSFRGAGRSSGLPIDDLRGANLFVVRDGRVVRLELHIDADRARRRFEGG